MEIIVEAEEDFVRELIANDLRSLLVPLVEQIPWINNIRIIVTRDFEGKVNELIGGTDYRWKRGITNDEIGAVAKTIPLDDSHTIVLSLTLYFIYDLMCICFILYHEIGHIINENQFPPIPDTPLALGEYFHVLYWLYDEYISDRSALINTEAAFSSPSQKWLEHYGPKTVHNYLRTVNDDRYYELLKIGNQ